MTAKFEDIVSFIKVQFPGQSFIPLHAPIFIGNERRYVMEAIDSTFVSSVGAFVDRFEKMMCQITGASHAIAIVNGTNALHIALILANVERDDEVLSQSLTFIATCNAISYIGAKPVFVDVDKDTLGMSPDALRNFLSDNAEIRDNGFTYNKKNNKRIKACVPMHTFGLPCRVDEIADICDFWNITLVEDAAESLGSYYKGKHTGVFGKLGTFSFNGNKTVTCGGGGAIVTNDEQLARKAKHLTTQAKIPHAWEFRHDEVGYNYRMPNLNAALACAQLEQLGAFVANKRELAENYARAFRQLNVQFFENIVDARSNYWLNAISFNDREQRDEFLKYSNENGVMTRPVWELMHRLPMFEEADRGPLTNSEWLADRLANIPSSVRI
ncbi:MAG TPA: LegC family aminotransferase [Mucilaginibacter sp.]|jgi:perosamine synthetase|nr:LegC family aminotransferase [Mucilaginibacter sp.]